MKIEENKKIKNDFLKARDTVRNKKMFAKHERGRTRGTLCIAWRLV
jgi:hypothetical protein